MDLGTGIRVVRRDPENPSASTLENTFWTESEPGFSHLFFAMGAEAAAFSAFRKALLAEGVSEMILLPTLLRAATNGRPLDFQVAFGLANLSTAQAVSSVALITTFLVDGDASGTTRKQKLRSAGVPHTHIFQLPRGKAIEDLVDRKQYLDVVDGYLAEVGIEPLVRTRLDTSLTVARAVDDFVRRFRSMPNGVGHKIIASRLASLGGDIRLGPGSKRLLNRLRTEVEAAFADPYYLSVG